MKYLFGFMLIGLFTFTASAQKFKQFKLIVNDISTGTPYETVIKKLGKPKSETQSEDNSCGGKSKTLFYDGLEIEMTSDRGDKNFIVFYMDITSSKWITDKGIRIGATPNQVMAKYGKVKYTDAYKWVTNGFPEMEEKKVFTGEKLLTYSRKKTPGKTYFLKDRGATTFLFKNNRLIRIKFIPELLGIC